MPSFAELSRVECSDPFSFLGIHPRRKGGWTVRAWLPWAREVDVVLDGVRHPMARSGRARGGWKIDLPAGPSGCDPVAPRYRLAIRDDAGGEIVREDPYRFAPTVDEERVSGFLMGWERRAHEIFGAHPFQQDGVEGIRFAVWAPHARAVYLTGDMNAWDGTQTPMRARGATGVWEIFLPHGAPGQCYKYRILDRQGAWLEKSDPFGRASELRPSNASRVPYPSTHAWTDDTWVRTRPETQHGDRPMSVYEVHAGSWRHGPNGWMNWRELADTLLPYVQDLGFTHIELMPVTEHPLDQSWGYQPVGFFSPTARWGSPDDLRFFVDRAHALGIGVLLDWVPGHFATDAHGLAWFDGTPLWEHPDPLQANHPDWGTLTFDYGKPAVRSFLISSALYWLREFHFDGIRVDAVASMLYLDYSRKPGEWTPNHEGGNTNLDAVDFLRRMNLAVHEEVPGALTIAEESTAWEGVSRPVEQGGLGFDQKWNMGWMNDTLEAMREDPVHRRFRYDSIKFSIVYAWSERFVLPLSHDEVVHGKGSLLSKMPGPDDRKFANLRLLLAWQWMHPGKKLLFMGGELGQWSEWAVEGQVDWALEAFETHRGVRSLVRDLNRLHVGTPALHAQDFRHEGFEWLLADAPEDTILAFVRWAPGWSRPVVVVANFTPVTREAYPIPVPFEGEWRLVLNSDARDYAGWGTEVDPTTHTEAVASHGRDHRLRLRVPGLSVLVLEKA